MKKFTLTLIFILLFSGIVIAQEERTLLFNPDTPFTVQDLGFQFLYPGAWLYDTSSGIQFAENEEDLAAEIDSDDATRAAGFEMSLRAYPIEMFGLEEGGDINDYATTLVELAELDVYERFERAVLTYRGVVISGLDPSGGEGVAVLWLQDEYVVFMGMGVPEGYGITSDVYYSFGWIIGTMRFVTDIVLTETIEMTELDGFMMDYPSEWFTGSDANGYYFTELEEDNSIATSVDELNAGWSVFFDTAPLEEELGLAADSDAYAVIDLLVEAGIYTEFEDIAEHLLLGELAVSGITTYLGGAEDLPPMIFVIGTKDGTVFVFGFKAPDAESLMVLKLVGLSMLNSIQATLRTD